jgi:hypothetical protein
MENNIKLHLSSYSKCQAHKKDRQCLQSLTASQCTAPKQRVHWDLFVPLLRTDGKNTFELLQMHLLNNFVHGLSIKNWLKLSLSHFFKITFANVVVVLN